MNYQDWEEIERQSLLDYFEPPERLVIADDYPIDEQEIIDEAIANSGTPGFGKFVVYRHFDIDGKLLYVGQTKDAFTRLDQHQTKTWFHQIVSTTYEHFETRELAEQAEKIAIRRENPIFNVIRYVN